MPDQGTRRPRWAVHEGQGAGGRARRRHEARPLLRLSHRLLQIAIVLASVIVTDGTVVLLASLLIAVLGLLMTLNGFTLAIAVPWMS